MSKNTSVTLGSHFGKLVGQQAETGYFGSVSETKLSYLRKELEEGENSGSSDYSLAGLIQELDAEDLS